MKKLACLLTLTMIGCGSDSKSYQPELNVLQKQELALSKLPERGFDPRDSEALQTFQQSCWYTRLEQIDSTYSDCLQINQVGIFASSPETHCKSNKEQNIAKVRSLYDQILLQEKSQLKMCLIERLYSVQDKQAIDSALEACYILFEWGISLRKPECQSVMLLVF